MGLKNNNFKSRHSDGQSTENRLLRLISGRCPIHGLAFKTGKFPIDHRVYPHNTAYDGYTAVYLHCPRKDCDVCASACLKDYPEVRPTHLHQDYEFYRLSHFKNGLDTSVKNKVRLETAREQLVFHLRYPYQYLLDETNEYRFGRFDYRARNMRAIYGNKPVYKIENLWFFHIKAQNHLLNFIKELPFILVGDYGGMIRAPQGENVIQETYYAFDPIHGIYFNKVRERLLDMNIDFLNSYYNRSLYILPPDIDSSLAESYLVDSPEGMPREDFVELVARLKRFYQTEDSVVLEYLTATSLERDVIEILYEQLQSEVDRYIKSLYPASVWYDHAMTLNL